MFLKLGLDSVEIDTAGSFVKPIRDLFARRARRPVAVADLIWKLAERRATGQGLARLARAVPRLADVAMRLSRI